MERRERTTTADAWREFARALEALLEAAGWPRLRAWMEGQPPWVGLLAQLALAWILIAWGLATILSA